MINNVKMWFLGKTKRWFLGKIKRRQQNFGKINQEEKEQKCYIRNEKVGMNQV